MALVVKDRVKETTATTGTGTLTLAGAMAGFQAFSAALSDGDTTYYALFESSTGAWEVGLGTFALGSSTLARTTILASSNAGSAINLTAGNAEVFITQPAGKTVVFDASGDLTLNQDPTSALQAATKQYVDTIAAAGVHYHDPVRVESPVALNATYNNGTAGVGATLTNAGTQAALVIDGVTVNTSDRVLIYVQTNSAHNGVYTVTDTGSASTNWVLTRATDADSYGPSDPDSLGQGDAFFVREGNTGAGELYVMTTEGTITFGTTAITFSQIASTAVYSAGNGLTLTGTTFAVGAGTGVTVNANDVAIGQDVSTSADVTFNTVTADLIGNADTATTASGVTANSVALGTDTTGNYVAAGAVSGNGLSGSASSEGATFTVTSNATNANTPSTIVFRDASGNFSAGTITASLSGNATTATTATTANSVAANSVALGTDTTGNYVATIATNAGLDGSGSSEGAAVTLSLNLSELTTSTSDADGDFFVVVDTANAQKKLTKANINISGFNNDAGYTTNVGDITGVTAGSFITGGGTSGTVTINVDATSANTSSKVVARDASGNFSAGTITAALSGNASTATALQTARTIGGVSFDGTANINLPGVNTTGNQDTSGNAASATTVSATVTGTSSADLVTGGMAGSDYFRIRVSGTATDAGFVEIATADNGAEPIYVRQYTFSGGDPWATLTRSATLLDASGNTSFPGTVTATFSGNLTGNVTGNASTATTWQTARTLTLTGDVTGTSAAFNGNGNISIATTIAANSVALGTDTTGNYVAAGAVSGNGLSGSASAEGATFTVTSNATNANTANTIVYRDASGNFSAGTITATLSGNATNITAYTINQNVGTANSPTFANAYIADNIIHSGDTDTYMGFHAANQWRVVTGGTERFEVNDSDVTVQSALKEKYVALSGTTPSVDVDAGGAFSLTTSGNTTFTFTAFTSGISGGFILQLTSGGAHTITWPASVDWAGGTAPDAPASGETDIYVFWSRDGGTTWYGVQSIDAAA